MKILYNYVNNGSVSINHFLNFTVLYSARNGELLFNTGTKINYKHKMDRYEIIL